MRKTFYISKAVASGGFNFVTETTKVTETIFNDLLNSKIKELLDDKQDQFENVHKQVIEVLETKKPVKILDRQFEIRFQKIKEKQQS